MSTDVFASLAQSPKSPTVRFAPGWFTGCALIFAGVGIRLACQRELGTLFTWEKSVKTNQQLITTGPYAVVRHPSYTGMLLATVGLLYCQVGPESWLIQSGFMEIFAVKAVAAVWLAYTALLPIVMFFRTFEEDRVLKKHFGKEWDAYAKRTRFRLIPYLF
jgi:protein-S-isoprenylcysteine O-methyltransferase Ste14